MYLCRIKFHGQTLTPRGVRDYNYTCLRWLFDQLCKGEQYLLRLQFSTFSSFSSIPFIIFLKRNSDLSKSGNRTVYSTA